MRAILIFLVRFYQRAISPWLGSNCRFEPTCSTYAIEAIQAYGPVVGSRMAITRISRCHPWHPGGYDPVPPRTLSESSDKNTRFCACHRNS